MGYKMIIHSAGGAVGHFSVEISNGETSTIRGFRAASGKSLLAGATLPVARAVENDESRVNKAGILKSDEIPLSLEQFDRVKGYFEHNETNPGKYDLNDRNCVDFANGALNAAGIDKNVGQVMTTEQDKLMSGAALYRNAKYPEPNRPLTFPEDGMYPGGTDPHAGVDKRSDATDWSASLRRLEGGRT
ncbi:hypothetical protein H261_20587 [Paramagnetospirillum caucaseum]|uniref:Uncharacterized protein n=1 Tax=Paramagnetospirillum caucaseum TaxID=1244869 RepID=M2Y4J2_9PROT|nr:hypothetical protein [Paramagnetospirillum caucaseum]EME68016.1 hypothetical protein H261_20587 [Paramagnetospirillum caucaseum]